MALGHCGWGTLRSECLGHKVGGLRPQCGPYLCFQTTGHRTQGDPIPESSPDGSAGLSQEGSWKATSGALLDTELSSG